MMARMLRRTIALALLVAAGCEEDPPAPPPPPPADEATPPPAPEEPPPVEGEVPFAEESPCPALDEGASVVVVEVRRTAYVVATPAPWRRVAPTVAALTEALRERHAAEPAARVFVSPRFEIPPRTAAAVEAARMAGFSDVATCDAGSDAAAGVLGPSPPTPIHDSGYSGPIRGGDRVAVPVVRAEVVSVEGGLARDIVERALRFHGNELRFCYLRAVDAAPELAGSLHLAISITPIGVPETARVTRSTVGDATVEQCMALAAQRWTFREADARTEVDVEVTLDPGA